MNNNQSYYQKILEEWFRRVRQNQHIHYKCADYYSNLNQLLGIPSIILATIVGTAVFSSIENDASGWIKIIVGLASISAAVLTKARFNLVDTK